MQHTFIPYLPVKNTGTEIENEEGPEEEVKKGEPQQDEDKSVELSDIELGDFNQGRKKQGYRWSKHEVCFICQLGASDHDRNDSYSNLPSRDGS